MRKKIEPSVQRGDKRAAEPAKQWDMDPNGNE